MRSKVETNDWSKNVGCHGNTSRTWQGRWTQLQEAGPGVGAYVPQADPAAMLKPKWLGMKDLTPVLETDRFAMLDPLPVMPTGLVAKQLTALASGSPGLVEHAIANKIRSQAPQPPPLP